jgi:hypothetical protein
MLQMLLNEVGLTVQDLKNAITRGGKAAQGLEDIELLLQDNLEINKQILEGLFEIVDRLSKMENCSHRSTAWKK